MAPRLLAIVAMAILLLVGSARAEGLLIIANPSVNVATPLGLGQIAAIYLLRITTWPEGGHIVPVNRDATSRIREKFTMTVLQQDNTSLAIYWNEMHFMGKQPPVVQGSDQAVLAFIRNVPGSIGYISASIEPIDVKVLARLP